MPQSITLDVKGLHTDASDISAVPNGSQAIALNLDLSRPGLAGPRRGYDLLTYGLPNALDRPKKLVFWNSELFAHYGTTFAWYDAASGFTSKGSLTAPSSASSIRTISSQNKNLYVTSDTGLKKTDAISTPLYAAGIPKGLFIELVVGGAGAAVNDLDTVTYRYLLGRKDANGVTSYGDVSGRYSIKNSAGSAQKITVKCYIPDGLDTTYFLQLYRSPGVTTDLPTDDLQLAYETPITSTDITNKYVLISDIVPDALLDATIYTGPTQQGLINGNTVPPLARDIAEFKTCLFYADTESLHRLSVTLAAVSGAGVVAGTTITISNGTTTEVYTGHASVYNASIKQFIVSTGGSSSQNIDATVKSFIKCVCQASTLVIAYPAAASATAFPGKALFESRTLGSSAFTIVSSVPAAFIPQLTNPANVSNTSQNDVFKNGLMFSKPNQQEAVPLKNLLKIGSSDDRIKRIVASRDGLFIFKERDGAYVLRGETEATFNVTPLDDTAKLVAADSLKAVNNLVYGLFEAGVCEVSDTGVTIVSSPIKNQIQPLLGAPLATVKSLTFGYGSDVDGVYVLAVPEALSATSCTKQFIYDTFQQIWATWDLNLTCGGIGPIDTKAYLGSGSSNKIKQERKAFDHTDYADYGSLCTITSYSGTTVFVDNTGSMARGDILSQGTAALAYIESVDSANGSVVIDSEQAWVLATTDVDHLKAIDCKLQWNPDFGGNAAGLKQYYECQLIQKQAFQKQANVVFSSDTNPSETIIAITSASGNGAFGMFDFGDEAFGGEQANAPRRLGIPVGHSRCSQLKVRFETRVAFSDFQVSGLALSFNPSSTRTTP